MLVSGRVLHRGLGKPCVTVRKSCHYPPAYGGNGQDPRYTYIESQSFGSFWSFWSIISSWQNHRTYNGLGLGLDVPLLR